MQKLHKNDIYQILKLYLIFAVPLILIAIIGVHYISDLEIANSKMVLIDLQKQRTKVIDYVIKDVLEGACEDLLLIKNSDDFEQFINSPTYRDQLEAEKLFLRMVNNKQDFDQIRFIDQQGQEVIRVNNTEDGPVLVAEAELQNQADRYYYQETCKLKDNEVYFSDMDLNIENGSVEIPYKPTMRLATPVYDNAGEYKGILIINYLTQNLLDMFNKQFEDLEHQFVKTYLINGQGYYLSDMDESKLFGFMLSERGDQTIAQQKEELWADILTSRTGYFENSYEINYYNEIKPLENINTRSDLTWYIVSTFDISELHNEKTIIGGLNANHLLIIGGFAILLLVIVTYNYYSRLHKNELVITTKIAENTHDAVVITDANTRITYVNPMFEKITGYKSHEVIGLKTNAFKSGKHSVEFYKDMWDSIINKGYWHGQLWDIKKDKSLYPKQLSIYTVKQNIKQKEVNYLGIFTDLTRTFQEKEYRNKLKNYNITSNLPNEHLMYSLINDIISKQQAFSIIYLSIENFNSILLTSEDDYQKLIKLFTEQLLSIIEKNDFIAHVTRNNFVICLTSSELDKFLKKLYGGLSRTLKVGNKEVYLDIRAGVSIFPQDGESSVELISSAYLALGKALTLEDKRFYYYQPDLRDQLAREMRLTTLLQKAIANREFEVYYQPQVEITKGKTVAAEALLRWHNPELGNISPLDFIPISEKTGKIVEIGYWIIENVFLDYLKIRQINPHLRYAINISPLQFQDRKLVSTFKKLAERYQIALNNFEVEITESIFLEDLNAINEKLAQFKALGLTVAIDDFGTGFSSLSYLKRLTIDKIKIDRCFIKDYPEQDNGDIVELITNIANKLKLKVIMEGAENDVQIAFLKRIGCNLVQGYYYSKPLNRNDFIQYLKAEQEKDAEVN